MKSFRTYLTLAAAVVAMASMTTSCGNSENKGGKSTSISSGLAEIACDASFEDIISQEIDVYEYIYPKANIMPYYVDENAAIDSLLNFSVKLAVTTRPLTEKEVSYLKSNKKQVRQSQIAVDALALIVNPANTMEIIDLADLRDILSGKLTQWDKVVPGSKLGDISVVFDHQGSSTVKYMRDSLLNGGELGPNCYAQKTPPAVFEAVEKNKNAIGVIGVSWINDDLQGRRPSAEELTQAIEKNDTIDQKFNPKVKVLKVQSPHSMTAYKPYQIYIFNGDYPLYRQIYLISTGVNGSLAHGFYSFVTGFQGQKLIQMTGVLPKVVHNTQMVNIN
ncbi:MAG: substrate-binding domain-containing protein [Firmicutes bacterium]|nr:substrate-binding domain-containing protein [Bacillota bacterium]MCM1401135.1 substrate-binding domain-containing protein [Bacteroides sp.]MCM1477042.1 substrate-binding domain-containing protein [Bacteroides sp.]